MPSPSLPQEILDHIIDTLHDDTETLRNCCLVAKSWIPRTRKYLFSYIRFSSKHLESWKKTFPDPSNSPACYARSMVVACPEAVRVEDAAEGGWITSFSGVSCLELKASEDSLYEPETFLIPFHKFSPTLNSLHVDFMTLPCSQFFKLVYSFPLLKNLTVICQFLGNYDDFHAPEAIFHPTPPPLSGSLGLSLPRGSDTVVRRLLDSPGGLRFQGLDVLLYREDTKWIKELMSACCNTLEFLVLTRLPPRTFVSFYIRPRLSCVCR